MDFDQLRQDILASADIDKCPKPQIPVYGNDQNYVFISYSHVDYKAVYCDLIEFYRKGVRFWYDSGLPAGQDWDLAVRERLQDPRCAGVVFYMSEALFTSRSIVTEIKLALRVDEEGQTDPMNYFCINLTDKQPSKILRSVILKREDIDSDWIGILMQAFRDKATYIPKESDDGTEHIPAVLTQMAAQFNVVNCDGFVDTAQKLRELEEKLEQMERFNILDGFLERYLGKEEAPVIPDGVRVIGRKAFKECESLKRIVIPEGVTLIQQEAFGNCENLEEVVLPSTLRIIGNVAFAECRSLKKLVIPEGVTVIDTAAFACCESLESVTLPSTLEKLGQQAFWSCYSLEFPDALGCVQTLEEEVFANCANISEICIPAGIQSIAPKAFYSVNFLKKVYVPDSVTELAQDAFAFCFELTHISLPAHLEGIPLDVPEGCAIVYR